MNASIDTSIGSEELIEAARAFIDFKDTNPGQQRVRTKSLDFGAPEMRKWDWRSRGLEFVHRHQGTWNACTSFAMAAMIETRFQIMTGQKTSIVPAYIHNCLAGKWDQKVGLDPKYAAQYCIEKGVLTGLNDAIPLERTYCNRSSNADFIVRDWDWVIPGTPSLDRLVSKGPMLVTMFVSPSFFGLRRHEIYDSVEVPDESFLHSMLLIGYDLSNRTAILLNSLGPGWGNDGFANIRFGSGKLLTIRYPLEVQLSLN